MPSTDTTVYIIDDDEAVRDSLALLLQLKGYKTAVFESAEAFLAAYGARMAGCILLDMRMSGMSGLALQSELQRRGIRLPVIIITAHGDTASTRAAFKGGAVDFIEKPIDDRLLLAAINTAIDRDRELRRAHEQRSEIAAQLERLTPREREVLDLVVEGSHNREIAATLDISPRTVEVYKARMMEKLQVRRSSELIRLILSYRQSDHALNRPAADIHA